MGLKSLAKINRSGLYDFWENSWDSNNLYQNYFSYTTSLQIIFNEIFNFFFLKYLFKNRYKSEGYTNFFKITEWIELNLYFSKIWVLKYHKWFVIIIYYYNITPYLKKKNKISLTNYNYTFFSKFYKNYNFKF